MLQPSSDEDVEIWNGAVEAAACVTGAVTVFIIGKLKALKWDKYGDLAIFMVTSFGGSFLVGMGYTSEIVVAYVGYILFRMSYQTMMTVASFEIAKNLKENSYGLIFGINSWFALGFEVILTITVADSAGLNLGPREQFYVYGGYFLVIGLLFACYNLTTRIVGLRQKKPCQLNSLCCWVQ